MTAAEIRATLGNPPVPTPEPVPKVDDPALYINRELSWLEFNARILAEANDPKVPLYERLKFLAIFASNLDEFFMVRVGGPARAAVGRGRRSAAGRAHAGAAARCDQQARSRADGGAMSDLERQRPTRAARCGYRRGAPKDLAPAELEALDQHFHREIFPVLTPIAIDPVHPFPHVRNKSINVGVIFEKREHTVEPSFGVVQVPTTLRRLIRVPLEGTRRAYVALEDLIFRHREGIFPQMKVVGQYAFRVTRNFDIELDEEEAEDLLITLQAELRRRERGRAVRIEVSGTVPDESIRWLCKEIRLNPARDVYHLDAPLYLGDMTDVVSGDERRDLRDEPFAPQYVPPLRDSDDFFETIRHRDVLLHHPYESFEAVVDFLSQAAEDPHVLAIKQTLYRTGGESPMVRALQRASELGKQVTAVVELKARFDEESNIQWAHALERSGVNVMYGLLGLKTHAKVLLVVRKELDGLRRYVHLATGNYNQQTARLYEDLSLFTANEDIGEDATSLFNLLTGYSAPAKWKRLIVAPLGLHEAMLGLIARETEHARAGRPARIVAKMNALVDGDVIAALYTAAQAGVEVDLLVRGICCLRPATGGVSERIRVHAIVDRFLEHARIFHFKNAGEDEVFCASADWMPRNFRRRVEVMFPILDESLKRRVIDEVLGTMRKDNCKGWVLCPDGTYQKVKRREEEPELRSQQRFMELARERARESDNVLGIGPRPLTVVTTPRAALEKLRRKGKKRRRRLGKTEKKRE